MKLVRHLILVFFTVAATVSYSKGVIEVPRHSYFEDIKIRTHMSGWQHVEIPETKNRTISLPSGHYKYSISIQSAVSAFEGEIIVSDNSYQYIHRVITPNQKTVNSWVSKSKPRSEEYKIEVKEQYCSNALTYNFSNEEYIIDACSELEEINNSTGLYVIGYMHEKGIGNRTSSSNKASDYYLKSYKLGSLESGAAYFVLNQSSPEAIKILIDTAEEGHRWSIGAAGEVLSTSNKAEEITLGHKFANQALEYLDPIGFKILSKFAYRKEQEDITHFYKASAFYNLYEINNKRNNILNSRYKTMLEELMLAEDKTLIAKETASLSDKYINSELYLLIDTTKLEKFKNKGDVSLVINNKFTLPIKNFESAYHLELLPSDKYQLITLKVNGDYETQISFILGKKGGHVHCLSVQSKKEKLKITNNSEDEQCPAAIVETTSIWEVMSQYM